MRVQFEFAEDKVKELDMLAKRLGFTTRVQLFNSALALFEWAVREREAGRIIASIDEVKQTYKEVDMPGLPVVRPSEAKSRETPKADQSPGLATFPRK
jgi:hypothetical protein